MYGSSVEFNFKGRSKFPTCIGAVASIVTISLLTIFTANRVLKFFSAEDPFFSMLQENVDFELIDLWENGFMFAVQNIAPEVGQVVVTHTNWGLDVEKVVTEIKMVECSELLPGGKHDGELNNPDFSI